MEFAPQHPPMLGYRERWLGHADVRREGVAGVSCSPSQAVMVSGLQLKKWG